MHQLLKWIRGRIPVALMLASSAGDHPIGVRDSGICFGKDMLASFGASGDDLEMIEWLRADSNRIYVSQEVTVIHTIKILADFTCFSFDSQTLRH